MKKYFNKKGQVWIETVLYTLIGLSLIGLVLAFTLPKINESKDRIIVEQSLDSLNEIDEKISSVLESPGNIRFVEISLKKGELFFDGAGNEIKFIIKDIEKPYSEPGSPVKVGRVNVLSEEGQKKSSVELSILYTNYDIKYNNKDEIRKFSPAATPYRFSIENIGDNDGDGIIEINMRESST